MHRRSVVIGLTVVTLFGVLTGCSSTPTHTAHGTLVYNGHSNDPSHTELVYRATGTVGEGADDATVTVEPLDGVAAERTTEDTILPWSLVTGTTVSPHVSMTVKSLSSHGTVSCEVSWKNVSIKNTATGDHVSVTCSGTLTPKN